MSETDSTVYLNRSVALAEHGRGAVAPNPLVGAVIVRSGEVIAEGYHHRYGAPHAEAEALNAARDRARGATLYCNLEPCSFTAPEKHQPPCTRRIIDAGIAHVVIGQLDPNPRVRGDGIRQLQAAGITVTVTDDPTEYLRLNDVFNTWMALQRPFVHLKAAISLDGRIATATGDSRWITDSEARTLAHELRAQRDAIAVGVNTVITDNPLLTTRLTEGHSPRPVVFDSSLRIPRGSKLIAQRAEELIVFCSAVQHDSRYKAELTNRGVTVEPLPHAGNGSGLDLAAALAFLNREGITSMLVEGGSALLTSFVRHNIFDRITLYVAPTIIGSGPGVIGDIGTTHMADALKLDGVRWKTVGDQQVLDGYHPSWLSTVIRTAFKEVSHVHGTH